MYWYRYIKSEPVRLNNLVLNSRQVYGVAYHPDRKAFVVTFENNTESDVVPGDILQTVLNQSRPMTNKQTIVDPTLAAFVDAADKPELANTKSSAKPANAPTSPMQLMTHDPIFSRTTPAIPKSFPVKIDLLDRKTKIVSKGMTADKKPVTKTTMLIPVQNDWLEIVKTSLSYVGTKTSPKGKFNICESNDYSTCFMRFDNITGVLPNFLVLNRYQIGSIGFGTIDVKLTAQVITHEYAHYMWYNGVVKQTDIAKFKEQVAAKRIHPNQFEHKGYSNPWVAEAWAILAEYMVHGRSARMLSTPAGYDIVEKYFDNNFLRRGIPTGDAPDTRYFGK